MKITYFVSPLVTFLCVAIALLLAVTQPVLVLVFAFLIPFWFFVADVLSTPIPFVRRVHRAFPFLALPVFSPRPPPAT
jgi:fumarate reductase subunit D